MRKFILLTALTLTLVGCAKIDWFKKNYPADNVLEQKVEELIESETNLKIDLSPGTPEDEEYSSSYLWN